MLKSFKVETFIGIKILGRSRCTANYLRYASSWHATVPAERPVLWALQLFPAGHSGASIVCYRRREPRIFIRRYFMLSRIIAFAFLMPFILVSFAVALIFRFLSGLIGILLHLVLIAILTVHALTNRSE